MVRKVQSSGSLVNKVNTNPKKSKLKSTEKKCHESKCLKHENITMDDDFVVGVSVVYQNDKLEILGSSALYRFNYIRLFFETCKILTLKEQEKVSKKALKEIKAAFSVPNNTDIDELNHNILRFLNSWDDISKLYFHNNDIGIIIILSEKESNTQFKVMSIEDFLIHTKFGSDHENLFSKN